MLNSIGLRGVRGTRTKTATEAEGHAAAVWEEKWGPCTHPCARLWHTERQHVGLCTALGLSGARTSRESRS